MDFEISWDQAASAVRLRRTTFGLGEGSRAIFTRVHEADGDFTPAGGAEHRAFFEVDDHDPAGFARLLAGITVASVDASPGWPCLGRCGDAAASDAAARGWIPRFEGRGLVPGQLVGMADEEGTLVDLPLSG